MLVAAHPAPAPAAWLQSHHHAALVERHLLVCEGAQRPITAPLTASTTKGLYGELVSRGRARAVTHLSGGGTATAFRAPPRLAGKFCLSPACTLPLSSWRCPWQAQSTSAATHAISGHSRGGRRAARIHRVQHAELLVSWPQPTCITPNAHRGTPCATLGTRQSAGDVQICCAQQVKLLAGSADIGVAFGSG